MDLMMRDLLGEELEPKVLTRLRKQLKQATNMIQSSHQSWTAHLKELETQQVILHEQHPATIKPNAWASQRAISAALCRLQAYENLLEMRREALSPSTPGLPRFSPLEIIYATMRERPIGTETVPWRLCTSISACELALTRNVTHLGSREHVVTEVFERAIDFQNMITPGIDAGAFAIACVVAAAMDAIEDNMDNMNPLDYEDRCTIEGFYDRAGLELRKVVEVAERNIHILLIYMSRLGLKVARQALIYEYFELPRA